MCKTFAERPFHAVSGLPHLEGELRRHRNCAHRMQVDEHRSITAMDNRVPRHSHIRLKLGGRAIGIPDLEAERRWSAGNEVATATLPLYRGPVGHCNARVALRYGLCEPRVIRVWSDGACSLSGRHPN